MIADMKKAWDRGDRKYVIPPGTYAINEPMPCCPGSTIDGGGKVTLHCAVLCLVEYHPAAGGGWMSGTMPPFDDDIDIWNMNEDQFKQP